MPKADPPAPKAARVPPGHRLKPWLDDEGDNAPYRSLTKQEAAAWRASHPVLSPWWVVAAQAALGGVMALLAGLVTRNSVWAWSLLYGAAVVVVPGALLARGTTGRPPGMSAVSNAVSFMSWELVKIGFSVAMLLLAPKIVQPLSWPALLAAMVLCMQVYWLALLWRRP